MTNGVRTFDPVGAFQRGRRGALQIEAAEQDIAREREAAGRRNVLGDIGIEQAQQQLGAGRATEARTATRFGQSQAIQQAGILNQSAKALRGLRLEQRDAAAVAISPQLQEFGIDPSVFKPGTFTDQNLDDVIAQTGILMRGEAPEQFTLKPGERRFVGEREIAAVPKETEGAAEIPPELVIGLDPEIANKGAAAFRAAGGGKDGLTAFQKIVDAGTEQQRRQASPQIIENTFSRASEAERVQLQAVMDAAKTTESGLKAAGKVREEQRRTKKAKDFQARAIELIDNILSNDELDDILGSIEGGIDFRLQDAESELIADIEEAGNILTADNMDLMTGVLSESDIRILKNLSGGALNRKRSEKRFRGDLTKLRDKLNSQQVITVDDTAAERAAPRTEQAVPPSGRQGGELMIDAQGNRAFVFPDGTFEEVQ